MPMRLLHGLALECVDDLLTTVNDCTRIKASKKDPVVAGLREGLHHEYHVFIRDSRQGRMQVTGRNS